MSIIIAIAGAKQAGKSTACDFIQRNCTELLPQFKWYTCAQFAFADELKKFCMTYFDLTWQQCYGTDDDKNTLTSIRWEDLPHWSSMIDQSWSAPTGQMTAREVMQQVGTNIFRKMKPNIWVDMCLKGIGQNPAYTIALISDVRFPNEAAAVQARNGKVIYLTRRVAEDQHESEKALNTYSGFDLVLDNQNVSISKKNNMVAEYLKSAFDSRSI